MTLTSAAAAPDTQRRVHAVGTAMSLVVALHHVHQETLKFTMRKSSKPHRPRNNFLLKKKKKYPAIPIIIATFIETLFTE
jgi:hypothetical protein